MANGFISILSIILYLLGILLLVKLDMRTLCKRSEYLQAEIEAGNGKDTLYVILDATNEVKLINWCKGFIFGINECSIFKKWFHPLLFVLLFSFLLCH